MAFFDMFNKKTAGQARKAAPAGMRATPAGAPAADCYSYKGSVSNYFGELLRNCFPDCQIQKDVVLGSKAAVTPSAAPSSWTCSCGACNTGKFCPECGSPRPVSVEWTCSCGNLNKGKFCPECGSPRPDAQAAAQRPVPVSAAGSECVPITYLVSRNGQPMVAIIICPKHGYNTKAIRNTIAACQAQGITAQTYYKEFRNEASYVCGRVAKALR